LVYERPRAYEGFPIFEIRFGKAGNGVSERRGHASPINPLVSPNLQLGLHKRKLWYDFSSYVGRTELDI
jgi:hypothetical protein